MKRGGESESRGASMSELSFLDMVRAYRQHHLSSAKTSGLKLLASPMSSLMTWLVIAIAIALPSVMSLALANVDQLAQRWDGRVSVSVYLRQGIKPVALTQLSVSLTARREVQAVNYISPEAGLAEFSRNSGFGDVLSGLDDNPLPGLMQLQLVGGLDGTQVAGLQRELQAMPLVEQVVVDLAWLQRLHQFMQLGQRMVFMLAGLLALGVLLIIGNTIRLAIAARKEEILVSKLLGGTNGFIRRPFLYTGLGYGLGGGLLALALCQLALWLLSGPVAELSESYGSEYQLIGLSVNYIGSVVGGAVFLGWLGAWLAVSRHLHEIEPR